MRKRIKCLCVIRAKTIAFLSDTGKPVAILPSTSNRLMLDRADGSAPEVLTPALATTLMSDAFSVYPTLGSGQISGWDLLNFVKPFVKVDVVRFVALLGLITLLSLATPIFTNTLIGTAIPFAERDTIVMITAILIVVAVGQCMLRIVQSMALVRFETIADAYLQAAIWDRVLRLPVTFFKRYSTGDLVNKILSVNAIRQSISRTMIVSIFTSVFSLSNLVLMFLYSPVLALGGAALLIVFMTVLLRASLVQRNMQRQIIDRQGRVASLITQLLTGVSKLRVANAEKRAFAKWADAFAGQRKLEYHVKVVSGNLGVFSAVFASISSFTFYVIASTALTTPISASEFMAFTAAYGQLIAGAGALAAAIGSGIAATSHYENLKPILDAEPEVDENDEDPGTLAGNIDISNITFRYAEELPDVVRNVSLNIRQGQFAAIVGGSGSGKSTLFRLILGFDRPRAGAVFYDGKDLANLDLGLVRQQLGVVLQNGSLMPGSIFQNIIGGRNLTLDDAWAAARSAGLEDDIKAMPMGMHTVVSEEAGTLSGGQRQRIVIARALIAKPSIILFDEATSALDNVSQAMITESLDKLKLTRVVIAHRLSTIRNADIIFAMHNGELVEQGTFDELMDRGGYFAELARRQLA